MKNHENLFYILQHSNATLIRMKDKDGYKCNFCSNKYSEPHDLKQHNLQEHNDIKRLKMPYLFECTVKIDITHLKCKLCERNYESLDEFSTHLKEDHNTDYNTDIINRFIPFKFDTEVLRCAICSTSFTNFKILQEHMNVHFRNFVCTICNAGFITRKLLLQHDSTHTTDELKCSQCEKTFGNETKRKAHEAMVHRGLKKNKCKFCAEAFSDYWSREEHTVKVHDVPRVVVTCHACERTFQNKRGYTRHVKKYHLLERNHECQGCGKKFFSSTELLNHQSVHTKKRIKCLVCDRGYASNKSLKNHVKTKHGDLE